MNNWKNIWNNRDIDSITLDYLLNINGFSSEVGSFNPKSFDQYFKNIFQHVELDRIKSCIEIGCGAGLFLYKLPSNIQKSGIDFSDQLISIAKKIIPEASFEVQDANEISTKRKYDLVFSHSVFQYFESYKYADQVLKRMNSLSKQYILILDILDQYKYQDYLEMRKKYNGDSSSSLNHLPFKKSFFEKFGAENDLSVKIFDNSFTPNENSKFRFNVIFSR